MNFIMFIKSWNPAGTWLIDNETVYPKNRIYCVDCQWFYSHFLFSFFFPSLSFDGSEASNNCPSSIDICPLFFLRVSAKRIDLLFSLHIPLFPGSHIHRFMSGSKPGMLDEELLNSWIFSQPFQVKIHFITLFFKIFLPFACYIIFSMISGNKHQGGQSQCFGFSVFQ